MARNVVPEETEATRAEARANRVLNKPIMWFLIVMHLVALPLAIAYVATYPQYWLIWIGPAVLMYVYSMLGISLGYHRDFTHRGFKSKTALRLIWLIGGGLALQGSALRWVPDHKVHHWYTEQGGRDFHTPLEYARDTRRRPKPTNRWDFLLHPWQHEYVFHSYVPQRKVWIEQYVTVWEYLKGIGWSHMGWLCFRRQMPPNAPKVDYLYGPVKTRPDGTEVYTAEGKPVFEGSIFTWQHKYYWVFAIATFVIPMLMSAIIGAFSGGAGIVHGVAGGLLVGGVLRVVVFLHVTWCVNSVCHLWGTRTKDAKGRRYGADDSRNNPIVALFSGGEGNHNKHHQDPASCRHGIGKWYDFDLSYRLLTIFRKRGWVWEMRVSDLTKLFRDDQILPADRYKPVVSEPSR